jgi:alpha-tubulin suppressor-like RCC1 family protein
MSEFSKNRKDSKKSKLVGIAVVAALFGIFGLTTNVAIADSNESSSSSSNSYIQSSISAGGNSTCAVLDGAAKCWGANDKGQLGNGSTTQSFSPVSVSGLSSGVTAISMGNNHACAVVSGAVKCWGANESGQLGNGTTTDSPTPVSVTGLSSGVTAVSVGGSTYSYNNRNSNYSCAVVSGAVKCWGANGGGQLGNGTTTDSPTPVSVTGLSSGVTAVSVGGSSGYGSDSVHACAVVSGAAKCWGKNGGGQLGNGTTTDSSTPVSVTGLTTGVAAIAVGGGDDYGDTTSFSCAVVSGAAKCWGSNIYGQLGNEETGWTAVTTAVQVSGVSSGVTAISAGDTHACAVDAGATKCWGSNSNGQLGNGATSWTAVTTAVQVSGVSSGVTALSLGYSHSCVVTTTALKCWGSNSHGQAGPTAFAVTQVSGLTSGVTALSSAINGNASHVCAIQSGGLKCWGHNMFGQLGNGTEVDANTPQQVIGLTSGVTSVDGLTCAVVAGAVKCWGNGDFLRLQPQSSTPVNKFSFSNATAVAGLLAVCVIADGAVQCWGDGYNGELGIGAATYASTPQSTGITSGATAISAGMRSHMCAVVSGAAMCWGWGEDGKLGTGLTTDARTPQQVIGLTSGVTAISAGSGHTCAVVSGAAKCWGDNGSGQLGNGSNTSSNTPVQVSGLTSGVTAIAAGEGTTCAVVNGSVKCWGSNGSGLLGSGLNESSNTPVGVLGMSTGATAITLSRGIACAVKTGAVKCWGSNAYGELGNGTTGAKDYFNITTPQEMDGIGPLTTTTTSTSSTTSTVAVTRTPTATAPAGTVAQGQVSVATIAPTSGTTRTTRTTTTTTVPPVVTTIAGAPVGIAPDAPAVAPGEASVVIDGRAVATTITRAENQITARAGKMSTTLSGITSSGKRVALDANGNLVVRKTQRLVLSASGFEADRDVAVWVYSSPTQLGVIKTTMEGVISGTFDLPAGLEVGDHRLVLESKKSDGQTSVVALGFSYATSNSGSAVTRMLIAIPLALAVLFGLFLPAISRRRKKEETA